MSENNFSNTNDSSSSSSISSSSFFFSFSCSSCSSESSSSSSIEQMIPLSPQETSPVEKSSLLSCVPTKRKESPFIHYPRKEQEKLNEVLKENLTLDINNPRIKNHYKVLPLISYTTYENENALA
jgi:hypothetical protein